MIPLSEIVDPDPDEHFSLTELSCEAKRFLESHSWCERIEKGFLVHALSRIVGVFYFQIRIAESGASDTVWVIVGDLPYAYIPDDNATGIDALEYYVYEMQRWIDAVFAGESVEGLIRINVPPTREFAEMLESRLRLIVEDIIPYFRENEGNGGEVIT